MALVIKKTVDLESLGEEYKGIVLEFRSIPSSDIPELIKNQEALGDDNTKVIPYFIDVLEKYFISGIQNESKVEKTEVGQLPTNALVHVFQVLSGQDIDPKAENESTSISTTESAQV